MYDSLVSPDIAVPSTYDCLRVTIDHDLVQSANASASNDVALLCRHALTLESGTLWKHDWWVAYEGYFENGFSGPSTATSTGSLREMRSTSASAYASGWLPSRSERRTWTFSGTSTTSRWRIWRGAHWNLSPGRFSSTPCTDLYPARCKDLRRASRSSLGCLTTGSSGQPGLTIGNRAFYSITANCSVALKSPETILQK